MPAHESCPTNPLQCSSLTPQFSRQTTGSSGTWHLTGKRHALSGNPLALQRRPLQPERGRPAAGHAAPKGRAGGTQACIWGLQGFGPLPGPHYLSLPSLLCNEPSRDIGATPGSEHTCNLLLRFLGAKVEDRVVCSAQAFKKNLQVLSAQKAAGSSGYPALTKPSRVAGTQELLCNTNMP